MMEHRLLEGKQGVVLGVANKKSIAWGIANAASEAGARLAFTYQGEKFRSRVKELVDTLPGKSPIYPCDVTVDVDIAHLKEQVEKDFGTVDFMVHSLAFADRSDLEHGFVNTSRKGYRQAQDISSYSLTALSRAISPLMVRGGSIVTLTYIGSQRAVPNYNVMGVAKAALEASVRYLAVDLGPRQIRVNALSAGPINTVAARGIANFTSILDLVGQKAPLKRNVTLEEVAGCALFLLSDLSRGVTGETLHVDAGFNIVGL